jgi:type VI secretion system protein VasG
MVPYRPMDPDILADIAKLKLASLGKRIKLAHGTQVTFQDSLVAELVSRCTESETGARALDHALRGSLMPNLARSLLERMADGGVPPKLNIGWGAGFGGGSSWRFEYGD